MPVLNHNPSIEIRDVARLICGYDGAELSKSVHHKIDVFNDSVFPILKPIISYKSYKISAKDNPDLTLENGSILSSFKLARTMRFSREMVCFLATAGPELDAEISRLTSLGRVSSAYVLDAMGSVLIERVVDEFQKETSTRLHSKGLGATVRFSPGYCDWPLTQQRVLFNLFDSQSLGVRLSRSCLMTPRKSISGVFGIYPISEEPEQYIPCWECGKRDCASRRAPTRKPRLTPNPASTN